MGYLITLETDVVVSFGVIKLYEIAVFCINLDSYLANKVFL